MKRRIASVLLVASVLICLTAQSRASQEVEFVPMTATAYCLNSNRCDGGKTREGICAVKGHYGEVACVYLKNKDGTLDFYGYFEVLDYCPKKGVIDIWMPTKDQCYGFGRKQVCVVFRKGKG